MSKPKTPIKTDAIWAWVNVPELVENKIREKNKKRPQSKRDYLINKALGEEIQRLRKDKGLTVVEIAKKLSITQAQFSYYENAQDNISIVALYDIADVLEIKVEQLLKIVNNSINVSD